MLAIAPADLDRVRGASASASAARSRCVGTRHRRRPAAWSTIAQFGNAPVDMPLEVHARQAAEDAARRDARRGARCTPLDARRRSTLRDAAYRVLRFPAVADKTFLVTIGDRTVGGLCARDQMVGPWQVPVADSR